MEAEKPAQQGLEVRWGREVTLGWEDCQVAEKDPPRLQEGMTEMCVEWIKKS